jgi:hypothetical protein
MRTLTIALILLGQMLFISAVFAQQSEAGNNSATCYLEDERQIIARYNIPLETKKDVSLPMGKMWLPGNSPMFLFTEAPLSVGNSQLAVGAYSMYLIPGKKEWTLIINKNVTPGAPYNEADDLVRVPMQIGELSKPANEFKVYFGHTAPKQCTMQLDYGKTRAWVEMNEK